MIATALTIAGSDPSGGAGIQADLKTFSTLKVYGMSVIAALTAQNTVGVVNSLDIPAAFVAEQLDAVLSDIRPIAAKTGMLASAETVEAVAQAISDLDIPFVVVDPVMIAKSGDDLADTAAVDAMKSALLKKAFVVTPNIPEAERLAGIKIASDEDRREAARRILALGPSLVVVKGGHFSSVDIVDLLFLRLARLGPTLTTVGDRDFIPQLARRWERRDSVTVVFELDPRARWHDGRTFVWRGREKRPARGEVSSALRFDATDPA